MRKGKRHILLPEIVRWLVNPAFIFAVFFSAVFIVLDVLVSVPQGTLLREGEVKSALYLVVSTSNKSLMKFASLCLCTFLAAGLYAEDYEENAVYMRIQRSGVTGYAFGKVLHTVLSAWLCAFLAFYVSMVIFVVCFGQTFFQDSGGTFGWLVGDATLLQQQKYLSYSLIVAGICGFRAAFYALMALAFSVFLPNRRAAIAVPVLLWYFNQFMLTRVEQIPLFLQPAQIYTEYNLVTMWLNINHYKGFLFVAGYTLAAAVLVYLLLWYSLRRNTIFGGKME